MIIAHLQQLATEGNRAATAFTRLRAATDTEERGAAFVEWETALLAAERALAALEAPALEAAIVDAYLRPQGTSLARLRKVLAPQFEALYGAKLTTAGHRGQA